ncbi:MAG: winged helix DNA-binding domain-containing protein [Thaumarchaeota archaeon]|nr:winged helix DNA-binding domain-containing protein [Nitrososphaerota archaeon]
MNLTRRQETNAHRLWNQHIAPNSAAKSPEDVLGSLGAMQAQDYSAALWAIGLRCSGSVTKRQIEDAIIKRSISRTWLMRGTLHFARSQDLRWMVRLFAPRLLKVAEARDRKLGLSDNTVKKCEALFRSALERDHRLTRGEMYKVLKDGGIQFPGILGYHLLYRAAWDGVICFGAHEGKQATFELLDERAARKTELSGAQALAQLASKYFTSRGPATIKDFAWWSGLTVSDAKGGVEIASPSLVKEEIEGKTYYAARDTPGLDAGDTSLHLLPAFDEYLVGYSDRSAMLGSEATQRLLRSGKIALTHSNGIFLPVVVADGLVVGTWKRKDERDGVVVTVQPFMKLDHALHGGIKKAAERYGDFLEIRMRIDF